MKRGLVFWFTGLSGAGKTTVAEGVRVLLERKGYAVLVMDGDAVRGSLHRSLGFSEADIKENNARIAEMCIARRVAFDVILVPIISPYAVSRANARALLGQGFFEIYFDADVRCVHARDTKGLYAKADRGEIRNLIGYDPSAVYEKPIQPDFIVHSAVESSEVSVQAFFNFVDCQLHGR